MIASVCWMGRCTGLCLILRLSEGWIEGAGEKKQNLNFTKISEVSKRQDLFV